MINLNSYSNLGESGMSLMRKSMDTANAAAAKVADGDIDVLDIAQTSMDMSKAKVQMAMGAFLVKTQDELTNTALEILMPRDNSHKAFGLGTKHDRYY
ncbi:MAG: hypothetical protein II948_11305 [Synergistaceae bacterium]|nr:hypothetical protein [Synergistaceae bacterium]MBQ4418359.1 hypothetical protein [Synergistaceae bacterium]MBQ6910363.1 hypothetical protein [Synergistaceae bacterium]MBQ7570044.1 hypothetical protein [Synergistaceae bacterium]MBQ9582358.1 hypothetical protein [Synergistaceae bacterium]